MLAINIPANFPIPFANSAGAPYKRTIPTPSQTGIQPGAASLTDGFPPLNFLPVPAGGVPPFGQDMNGLLYWITQAIQWQQLGGYPRYDAAFSAAIGGYPQGAMLAQASGAGFWLSTADNNVTNPDTGGAGWTAQLFVGGGGGNIAVSNGLVQLGYVSPTQLLLSPKNGNSLLINGSSVQLPAAGLPFFSTIPNPVLGASTIYNLYAGNFTTAISAVANNGGGLFRLTVGSTTDLSTGYILNVGSTVGAVGLNANNWTITVVDATHVDLQGSTFAAGYTSGGTLSGTILRASTTVHATGANGTEVKSGDATQALVGKFKTSGATQFTLSTSDCLVRSWFNDPGFNLTIAGVSTINTLNWANEGIDLFVSGRVNASPNPSTGTITARLDAGNIGIPGTATNGGGAGPDVTPIFAYYSGRVTEAAHAFNSVVTGNAVMDGIKVSSTGRQV